MVMRHVGVGLCMAKGALNFVCYSFDVMHDGRNGLCIVPVTYVRALCMALSDLLVLRVWS